MSKQAVKVTVSGSFRQAMSSVQEAVYAFTDAGAEVLSPADPRVVDQFGDFLFVASDRVRAIKLVQNRHLAAIEASDLVWLVVPDGYIGQSGAMELGYATAVGTPVFCSEVPADLTLRHYVTALASPEDALAAARPAERATPSTANVLLDPLEALESAHCDLERIAVELTRPGGSTNRAVASAADRLHTRIASPLRPR